MKTRLYRLSPSVLAFAFVLQLLCEMPVGAQVSASVSLSARLKAAFDSTTLDDASLRPWHWKMETTTYDPDGKSPQSGTIEIWSAQGNMLSIMSLGSDQMTTLRVGDKIYRTDGDTNKFVPLDVLFMYALHLVPRTVLDPAVKTQAAILGKSKLDCVEPVFLPPDPQTFPSGAPLAYCFSSGTDELVASIQPGGNLVSRARIGAFLGKHVSLGLQIKSRETMRAEYTTTSLSTFAPANDQFNVAANMHPVSSVDLDKSSLALALVLEKNSPQYPLDARRMHVAGSEKFDAVIDEKGRVSSKHIPGPIHPYLAEAASRALSNWIYRPYEINGIAVPVKTQVTINFSLQ